MAVASHKPSNLSAQPVIATLEDVLTAPTNKLLQVMMDSSTDGWLFLNILDAMVKEVHDLGVPLEYIRHCVRTRSQRLELSEDGSKIRLRRKASNAEGPSKPSEHFGITDDIDMQHQDAADISSTSNPPFTSKEFQSRPRSPANNVFPSASSGGATSTSSSSYFQPYTPIFSRSATDDSSSSSLTSLYSNSSNSSSDGEKNKKAAPVIYVEGGTFCLDLSKDIDGEIVVEVSEYVRATNIVLGEVIDMSPKGPPSSQLNECFNCGSMQHSVQGCPEASCLVFRWPLLVCNSNVTDNAFLSSLL
ncbi:hypothetical protein BC938DRAFT_482495 [Jimgerdemannia flammicorona]|uniref:CCHC-type domain-containing protein n=1 Tax=Jimgerdemannia flammicorona TaxID=994334 RepID=A0A433QDW8_9FUNG|nr:hypothetical protein BC938DRAFT_482495 [Jimgerdemannia flammicorona]